MRVWTIPGYAVVALLASSVYTPAGADASIFRLTPGDNVAAMVRKAEKGSIFVFSPGIYRVSMIQPKSQQSFVGEPGAILSGAVPVTGWVREGVLWTAGNYPVPSFSHGEGRNGMAKFREDLVVDGIPFQRVASRDALSERTFYYENGRVWIAVDPTSKETLALEAPSAFISGNVSDVTISNLTIRYFASMAQHGAIDAHDSIRWSLTNLTVEANHGAGVEAGTDMTIHGGSYCRNGEVGIHAAGVTNLAVRGVTVCGNNYAGFNPDWDAGGIKVLRASNVSLSDSVIFQNNGNGVWFDWDNQSVIIDNNYIHHNGGRGIQIEASGRTSITGNVVEYNNTFQRSEGYWGAEILVQNSSRVSVVDNRVVSGFGQGIGLIDDARPPGAFGSHITSDNMILGNTLVMLNAGSNGLAASADQAIAFGGTNHMDSNIYVARAAKDLQFTWNGERFTADGLTNRLIEQSGRFIYTPTPEQYATGAFLKTPSPPPAP